MNFEIIGDITDIEPIAMGSTIREVARLRKQYGRGRWRKLKGIALIRLECIMHFGGQTYCSIARWSLPRTRESRRHPGSWIPAAVTPPETAEAWKEFFHLGDALAA